MSVNVKFSWSSTGTRSHYVPDERGNGRQQIFLLFASWDNNRFVLKVKIYMKRVNSFWGLYFDESIYRIFHQFFELDALLINWRTNNIFAFWYEVFRLRGEVLNFHALFWRDFCWNLFGWFGQEGSVKGSIHNQQRPDQRITKAGDCNWIVRRCFVFVFACRVR